MPKKQLDMSNGSSMDTVAHFDSSKCSNVIAESFIASDTQQACQVVVICQLVC